MKSYAILVGIDSYRDEQISGLQYAGRDVLALKEQLISGYGFDPGHITVFAEAGAQSQYPEDGAIVEQFSRLCRIMGPEDTFLFYFAGHGIENEDGVFLLTANTRMYSPAIFQRTSIPVSLLAKELRSAKVLNRIFIIDSCRNNPDKGRGDEDNLLSDRFSREIVMAAGSGRTKKTHISFGTLFAASEGQRAYEYPRVKHGAFSHYLLKGLEEFSERGEPVDLGRLERYIHRNLQGWCREHLPKGKRQSPWLVVDGSVPELIPVKRRQSKAKPSPPPMLAPTRLTVEDLKETGVLEEYIEEGGKLKGKQFAGFFKEIRREYEINSAAELKVLLRDIFDREREKQMHTEAKSRNKKRSYKPKKINRIVRLWHFITHYFSPEARFERGLKRIERDYGFDKLRDYCQKKGHMNPSLAHKYLRVDTLDPTAD